MWAINPKTGVAKIIAQGDIFTDGPILVEFNSQGKLYVILNSTWGNGQLITLSANGKVTPIVDITNSVFNVALAINSKSDNIYFKMEEGSIYRLEKNEVTPQLFASNIGASQGISFNKGGNVLFLGNRDFNQILEIKGPAHLW